MNKELNHLLDSYIDDENFDYSCYISIEKKLETLDIIKNHKLLNYIFKNEKCMNMYHLSKEEYDLLKEVLL